VARQVKEGSLILSDGDKLFSNAQPSLYRWHFPSSYRYE